LRLIDRTDDLVVREHWRGGGDIVQLAESAAAIAPMLMPKRVARVLLAKGQTNCGRHGFTSKDYKFEPVLGRGTRTQQSPPLSFDRKRAG
jgi:hypothetical protein